MDKNEIKKECADLILGMKLIHLVMEETERGSGDLAIDVVIEELSKLRTRKDNPLTETMMMFYDPALIAGVTLHKEAIAEVEVRPVSVYKRYIGTKTVQAAPAVRISEPGGNVRVELLARNPVSSRCDTVDMGYKVIYPDGYESFCPLDAFEEAYRPADGMNFGLAIEAAKKGAKIARKGWNGKGIYLELQVPDEHSKMTLPYIYIVTNGLVTDNPHAPKGCVPWIASQTDMLADDWYIVE